MFLSNESSKNAAIIIVFSSLVFLVIFITVIAMIESSKNRKVRENSPYYLKIKSISENTHFRVVNMLYASDSNSVNSKRKFDTFNYSRRCTNYILNNKSTFINIVSSVEYNKKTLADYKKNIKSVPHTNDEELAKKIKLSLKSIRRRETKLVKEVIKVPVVDYQIKIKASYTSPKGRNSYAKTMVFSFGFIKEVVESISFSDRITPTDLHKTPNFTQPKEKVPSTPKQDNRPTNSPKPSKVIRSIEDLEEID